MATLFEQGRSLGQTGARGTPRQDTHQRQNQIDAGFRIGRQPPPPPPPVVNKTVR